MSASEKFLEEVALDRHMKYVPDFSGWTSEDKVHTGSQERRKRRRQGGGIDRREPVKALHLGIVIALSPLLCTWWHCSLQICQGVLGGPPGWAPQAWPHPARQRQTRKKGSSLQDS